MNDKVSKSQKKSPLISAIEDLKNLFKKEFLLRSKYEDKLHQF